MKSLTLKERIRDHLSRRSKHRVTSTEWRGAGVLMPLYAMDDDLYVLLTRRTDEVEHHKGQISFPGGAVEPGDPDLLTTALRETEEEVGIARADVEILGELDDVETWVSGFVITPFVGVIPYPYPLRPNPREIQEMVFVPLSVFLDPGNLRMEYRDRGGVQIPLYFYQHGPHVIWGATAKIVKNFVEVVFGDAEPGPREQERGT